MVRLSMEDVMGLTCAVTDEMNVMKNMLFSHRIARKTTRTSKKNLLDVVRDRRFYVVSLKRSDLEKDPDIMIEAAERAILKRLASKDKPNTVLAEEQLLEKEVRLIKEKLLIQKKDLKKVNERLKVAKEVYSLKKSRLCRKVKSLKVGESFFENQEGKLDFESVKALQMEIRIAEENYLSEKSDLKWKKRSYDGSFKFDNKCNLVELTSDNLDLLNKLLEPNKKKQKVLPEEMCEKVIRTPNVISGCNKNNLRKRSKPNQNNCFSFSFKQCRGSNSERQELKVRVREQRSEYSKNNLEPVVEVCEPKELIGMKRKVVIREEISGFSKKIVEPCVEVCESKVRRGMKRKRSPSKNNKNLEIKNELKQFATRCGEYFSSKINENCREFVSLPSKIIKVQCTENEDVLTVLLYQAIEMNNREHLNMVCQFKNVNIPPDQEIKINNKSSWIRYKQTLTHEDEYCSSTNRTIEQDMADLSHKNTEALGVCFELLQEKTKHGSSKSASSEVICVTTMKGDCEINEICLNIPISSWSDYVTDLHKSRKVGLDKVELMNVKFDKEEDSYEIILNRDKIFKPIIKNFLTVSEKIADKELLESAVEEIQNEFERKEEFAADDTYSKRLKYLNSKKEIFVLSSENVLILQKEKDKLKVCNSKVEVVDICVSENYEEITFIRLDMKHSVNMKALNRMITQTTHKERCVEYPTDVSTEWNNINFENLEVDCEKLLTITEEICQLKINIIQITTEILDMSCFRNRIITLDNSIQQQKFNLKENTVISTTQSVLDGIIDKEKDYILINKHLNNIHRSHENMASILVNSEVRKKFKLEIVSSMPYRSLEKVMVCLKFYKSKFKEDQCLFLLSNELSLSRRKSALKVSFRNNGPREMFPQILFKKLVLQKEKKIKNIKLIKENSLRLFNEPSCVKEFLIYRNKQKGEDKLYLKKVEFLVKNEQNKETEREILEPFKELSFQTVPVLDKHININTLRRSHNVLELQFSQDNLNRVITQCHKYVDQVRSFILIHTLTY
ncbi:hypothetical protein J6590_040576 [Homalodisca vitripennis]|nr:hypothetical protein J6590_040576 [Homalodisca vitripennis]